MKYIYGNHHFWARGYYVDTGGKNERIIQEYIQHQLSEDLMMNQINQRNLRIRLRVRRSVKSENKRDGPLLGAVCNKRVIARYLASLLEVTTGNRLL